MQGWKLQTVCLSGAGQKRGGQVKILDTFPKERLKFRKFLSACMSGTGRNSAGHVDIFGTFPKERLNYFVISTPGPWVVAERATESVTLVHTELCSNDNTVVF